jgi:hypothetical protein
MLHFSELSNCFTAALANRNFDLSTGSREVSRMLRSSHTPTEVSPLYRADLPKTDHVCISDVSLRHLVTTDVPKAFRSMAETGNAQAKEAFDKISGATTDATDLMRKAVQPLSRARNATTDSNNHRPLVEYCL